MEKNKSWLYTSSILLGLTLSLSLTNTIVKAGRTNISDTTNLVSIDNQNLSKDTTISDLINQSKAIEDSTKVVIHYNGNADKWIPYIWGLKPNGNAQQYSWTGKDEYGNYANIDLNKNYQQLGVLIKDQNSWDKDGSGKDRVVPVDDSGKAEVWFKQGIDDAQNIKAKYSDVNINLH